MLRRICQDCKQTFPATESSRAFLGIPDGTDAELASGRGCDACFGTGYRGRVGVFEIMTVSTTIRDAILKNRPPNEIMDIAVSEGMTTLEEAAKKKVLSGETTVTEVHRVLTTYSS